MHIPFYVWRSAEELEEEEDQSGSAAKPTKPNIDPRKDLEGNPLRGYYDASFLDWGHPDRQSFLYEAQVSCIVAGPCIFSWQAWTFADSYYDKSNQDRETVESYYENSGWLSPCNGGQDEASDKVQDPREYFLILVIGRMGKVFLEWDRVVGKVKQRVKGFEQA